MVAPSDVWKRYVAFVDGNPEGASELESVVKWIAYGVSGKKRLLTTVYVNGQPSLP